MTKRLSRDTVIEQPNQTLAKALLMLEAFTEETPVWGVRELSRYLNTNPTTVHRLATTLMNGGYMEQDPETRRYRLGSKLLKLASVYLYDNPLPKLARKVFERYADQFEHNFYLGTLSNYEVVYLAALDGRGRIKIVVTPGSKLGLHNTALGKVLLASQNDEYIDTYIRTVGLQSFTDRTLTTSDQLWQAIREARQNGYAINNGERYREVGAVGVPLCSPASNGTSLAISLAYPQHLIETSQLSLDTVIELARTVASEINAAQQYLD